MSVTRVNAETAAGVEAPAASAAVPTASASAPAADTGLPVGAERTDPVPLSSLSPGASATVVRLTGDTAVRWRMLDLGLVPGTKVTVVRRSPLGDPTLYGFRGTMIALRQADAATVLVRPAAEIVFDKDQTP